MDERYEIALKDVLEMTALSGHATVPKWRLSRWYGQVKFTVNIRRDLRERWLRLIKDELGWTTSPKLKLAETGENIIMINADAFFDDKE